MILRLHNLAEAFRNGCFLNIYSELSQLCYHKEQSLEFYLSSFDGSYLLLKYPKHLKEKPKASLKSRFNK